MNSEWTIGSMCAVGIETSASLSTLRHARSQMKPTQVFFEHSDTLRSVLGIVRQGCGWRTVSKINQCNWHNLHSRLETVVMAPPCQDQIEHVKAW